MPVDAPLRLRRTCWCCGRRRMCWPVTANRADDASPLTGRICDDCLFDLAHADDGPRV